MKRTNTIYIQYQTVYPLIAMFSIVLMFSCVICNYLTFSVATITRSIDETVEKPKIWLHEWVSIHVFHLIENTFPPVLRFIPDRIK